MLGKDEMVSDSPCRCMTAPPALTAATAKFFTPGVFFRVQATQMSGAAARAAATMSRAAVATPDQISIRVWATFQPRSKRRRGPRAAGFGAPGGRPARPPTQSSTAPPPAR